MLGTGIDFDRMKKRIKPLLEVEAKIKSIDPDVFYEPGPWCLTKLISLAYFVDIYTRIIPKVGIFNKMRYIELLSGAGLCRVKEIGDIVAGSALIAATMRNREFDEYILVELDLKRSSALQKRMNILTNNARVIVGDCNKAVDDIVNSLGNKDHYLAFVDSEGLEVNWSTIKKLLSKQGDLIFNFQSSMVTRVVGRAKAGMQGDAKKLDAFFGDDRWKKLDNADELLLGYVDKIKQDTNRKRIVTLPIKGDGSYRYDLILATKVTKGENPWMSAMDSLSETISEYNPEFIRQALNILTGRIDTLDKFL